MRLLAKMVLLILVGMLIAPCSGRLSKQWSPDELLENSDVVVLGTVESVVAVERKESEAATVFGDRFSLNYYEATIKVNVVIKGEHIAKSIKLRFSRTVWNRGLNTDPPDDINLESNQFYLFYLTATNEEAYLNVLHDEVDQDKAVIQIHNTLVESSVAPNFDSAGLSKPSLEGAKGAAVKSDLRVE